MENKHYIPKGSQAYSPKGVRDKFEQAVTEEGGNIEKVLKNKHKYKELLELWHASFLAWAINKWLNKKYFIYPADNPMFPGSPDTIFLNEKDGEAFPVEITELHLNADDIWRAKGSHDRTNCHLLIISRKNEPVFNVSEFARAIQQHDWKFERIWLAVYTGSSITWTFFELFPPAQTDEVPSIKVSTKNKEDMAFWY